MKVKIAKLLKIFTIISRMTTSNIVRGVTLSLSASILFAAMSAYTQWLSPLSGMDLLAWRVLWTLPVLLVLLWWRGLGQALIDAIGSMLRRPLLGLFFLALAAMLGVQVWLFLWGSVNGRALEVSLGYFMLPLTMVLVGRFYYREQLDIWQRLAVFCACVGVLHELWLTRAFAWPSLVVALGYPPYLVMRRHVSLNSLVMFALEMLLLAPAAIWVLAHSPNLAIVTAKPPLLWLLLPVLGLLSTMALACYLRASSMLPMALFGILGYVEPVLLVIVATAFLHESLTLEKLGTYLPIWLAVGFTAIHSVKLMQKR